MRRMIAFVFVTLTAFSLLGILQPAFGTHRSPWPHTLQIGTASIGGTYVVYGDSLARLISDRLGIPSSTQKTGGPYHNFALVQGGYLELGLTTVGPARESWNGENPVAPGLEMRDVRALFPMYRTPFQVIALKRSGISGVAELGGRRVGVGPMGGTCAGYWPRFFDALDLSGVEPVFGNANELGTQLTHGLIDAFAFCAGLPIGVFEQLSRNREVHLFAFDSEQQAQLVDRFGTEPFTIPARTYSGQEESQRSVAFWNFAIAHKDLPEDLVYELMTMALDQPEVTKGIHPSAAEMRAENLVHNREVWFHPGAVRYYRERGLSVPDDLLPPELDEDTDAPAAGK
jgi:uncharacterized protein